MSLSGISTILAFIDGRRMYETPGFLIDLGDYTPLVFGINPEIMPETKSMVVEDHVIPGRHAPLQEPVAGGAEQITLELLFLGSSLLNMIVIKSNISYLFSLFHPTRGDGNDAWKQIAAGSFNRDNLMVKGVGRRVALTYGTWILDRPYLPRQLEVSAGPGKDPITNMPYRARARLTLQEDYSHNVDYIERRWGIPSNSAGAYPLLG